MPRPDATDLSPESLLQAYANGAFPMADAQTGEVRLYTCDPRCVIPLESFALPKSAVRA
ncbi:MAG: leucyl/phenylalanyl-tRNA--protein transferase, partial [Phycisphaerales bacterium]